MKIDQDAGYLDLLSAPPHRDVVPAKTPDLPVPTRKPQLPIVTESRRTGDIVEVEGHDPQLVDISDEHDVRHLTPREMIDLAQTLYAAGILDWNEYSMLAFQPEVQPGYDRTIGALTGRPADPGSPRDFIAEWSDRLSFAQRYNPADHKVIRRSRCILAVLTQIDRPTNILA